MSHDLAPSNDAEGAAHEPRVVRALDVIVCVDAPSKGLFRRVRRLLRQCTGETRLIVVDAGHIEALVWSRLQGLARDAGALLLLRHHGAGGPSSVELALAHSAGRDVLLLDGQVQVFPRFVARLARAMSEDERTGIVSPISNQRPHAADPSWGSALPPAEGISAKRWAKLLQRVALKSRPELLTPDAACLLLRRELLDVVGPPPADAAALGRYADEARQRGFRVRLADDVYVHREAAAEAVQQAPSADPAHPLGDALAWHTQRGTVNNRTAPLIVLDGSPFSTAALDEGAATAAVVRSLLERLRLPRAVLAYPAVSGIELAEILDGRWQDPLVYRWELGLPLAPFVEDTSAAEQAMLEVIELFQIGFVHTAGDKALPRVLGAVLASDRVPFCVSVTDASPSEGDAAQASLLAHARAILCPSEATRAELCQRFLLKAKRVHVETAALTDGDDAARVEERLRAWTAAYDACQSRAPVRARWLRREQLQRLRALYRGSAPLTRPAVTLPAAALTSEPAPLVERWVQRIGRRAPAVLRSAWSRLPYPSKQQRKPR